MLDNKIVGQPDPLIEDLIVGHTVPLIDTHFVKTLCSPDKWLDDNIIVGHTDPQLNNNPIVGRTDPLSLITTQ